jgi:hypothetical protein
LKKKRQQFIRVENERDFNEALIESREQGIQQIESTIIQVNEIFKDLSIMVKEQGILVGWYPFISVSSLITFNSFFFSFFLFSL